jgi:hypothetical protein
VFPGEILQARIAALVEAGTQVNEPLSRVVDDGIKGTEYVDLFGHVTGFKRR